MPDDPCSQCDHGSTRCIPGKRLARAGEHPGTLWESPVRGEREPRSPVHSCIYNTYFEDCAMTASAIAAPRFPRAGGVAVTAWLALALLAGATGFLARLPFPGPQLIFLALFAATLVAATTVPAPRAWVDALPLRTLIGINALRFIWITFLVLAARGEIAPVFAERAGWGDIATALLALGLVAAGEP